MSTFQAGTIFIPNEETSNQSALISAVDGSVIDGAIAENASGEGGAVMPDGTHLIGSLKPASSTLLDKVQIFDANFTSIGTPAPFSSVNWDVFSPMASDFASTFYVSHVQFVTNPAQVTTVSKAGVIGATTWTLDTIRMSSMGVSFDNTILYYGDSTNGGPIRRWDLVGNAALGVLVDQGANIGKWGDDLILVPGTSSFIILYQPDVGTQDFEVRRYTTDGVLLSSYALVFDANSASPTRLSLDLGNLTTAFWVRTFQDPSGDTSTFNKIRFSDGSVLKTFTIPTSSVTPGQAPGSCPFFAWSAADSTPVSPPIVIPPPSFPPVIGGPIPPPAGSSGDVVADPIRRLRRSPHLSREQLWNFYSYFQLDYEAGADRPVTEGEVVLHLRWSDDGGHTWSNLHPASVGKVGQTKFRAYWRRLGRSRDRVFEVVDSSNTKVVWLQAFMGLDPGIS